MTESHNSQANGNAPGTTVLSAVAAGIATTLTAAYGFGLWGGVLFPSASDIPYTEELASAARWRFLAASATFGLLAVLPSLALLYVTSWTKERLVRELSRTKAAEAAAYEKESEARSQARNLQEDRHALFAADLARANAAAEGAKKAKAEFLANLSYELRTPMNVVAGLADVLSRSTLSVRQRRFVDSIRSAGRSVLAQIDDMLDYSGLDAGNMVLRESDVNLGGIIAEIAPPLAELAQQKHLELSLETAEDVPPVLRADGRRLRTVLRNLIASAIQSTERGNVDLKISFARSAKDRGALRIEVSGTAAGISKEERERILQVLNETKESPPRGPNINLAIARKLVELMNGTLSVESGEKGAVLSAVIPMAIAQGGGADARAREEETTPMAAGFRQSDALPQYGLRILLVEDSAVNREVALEHLSSIGCGADVALDGIEAIEAYRRKTYDVVLMDCQMPRCDGYEATRRIRAIEKERGASRPVPIIALTAHAMPGDREKCLASGMTDYIAKPYALEDVIRCFDRWGIELSASSRGEGAQSPKVPGAERSPLDSEVANALRALKPALWGRLIRAFLTQAAPARQALPVALAGSDFDTIKMIAHSFKSASANIGALELSELGRRLEAAALGRNGAACAEYGTKFETEMARLCQHLENEENASAAAKSA